MYEHAFSCSLVMQILKTIYNDKSLTVKCLSHVLGYSESYLRAYFKKTMDLPLGRFIIEIRLTEAMRLLSRTDKQVTSIAELCGYDSVYAFSRSFKNHVGVSPSEYRYRIRVLKESGEDFRFRIGTREPC
jgi:AraC family transcriptional regulator of arabinose operon